VVFRSSVEMVHGRGKAGLPGRLPRLAAHGGMVKRGGRTRGPLRRAPRRGGGVDRSVGIYQLRSRCSALGSFGRGLGFLHTYLSWNLRGIRKCPWASGWRSKTTGVKWAKATVSTQGLYWVECLQETGVRYSSHSPPFDTGFGWRFLGSGWSSNQICSHCPIRLAEKVLRSCASNRSERAPTVVTRAR
jgi:hypothetical protein